MSHPANNSSTSSTQVVKQQPKMMLDDTMMTAMAVDGDTSNAATGGADVRMGTEDDFFFMDDLDSSDDDSSSDDDGEGDDDDDDDDDDDSEASLVHNDDDPAAAAAAFHGAAVAQALQQLVTSRSNGSLKSLGHEPSTERAAARRRGNNVADGTTRTRMQGSSSMANLLQMKMALDQQQGQQSNNTTAGNKMHLSVSAGNIGDMAQDDDAASTTQEIDESVLKPDDHLATLIGGPGQLFSYDSLEGFFLPVRPEYVQAWTNELTRAIRDHDLDTLQRMHNQGQRLQACNQFGESVVHLTVRRGTPEMLRFLLQDAGVSMRVCCDYGRTPLHDAAWSLASNMGAFEKMELLLRESPMQLYITDKRGFTPLAYVPRNRWKECNAFLDRQYAKGRLFRMGSASAVGSGSAAVPK